MFPLTARAAMLAPCVRDILEEQVANVLTEHRAVIVLRDGDKLAFEAATGFDNSNPLTALSSGTVSLVDGNSGSTIEYELNFAGVVGQCTLVSGVLSIGAGMAVGFWALLLFGFSWSFLVGANYLHGSFGFRSLMRLAIQRCAAAQSPSA